ncbi:2403_t:CDS:2, partial [Ambispora gerdemannii]
YQHILTKFKAAVKQSLGTEQQSGEYRAIEHSQNFEEVKLARTNIQQSRQNPDSPTRHVPDNNSPNQPEPDKKKDVKKRNELSELKSGPTEEEKEWLELARAKSNLSRKLSKKELTEILSRRKEIAELEKQLVRIKSLIEEGKSKLSLEGNNVNAKLVLPGGIYIQKEDDNTNLLQIKDKGGNDIDVKYDIMNLKIVANDEKKKNDYDRGIEFDGATNTLILNTSDFGNGLDSIDISSYFFNDGFPPSLYNPSDFKNYQRELFALEDLLTDLETNYQSPQSNISNSATKLNELLVYYYPSGDAIKQDLFDLRESPGKTGIFGFANANGFAIAQRGGSQIGTVTIGKPYYSGDQTPGASESGDDHLLPGDPNVEFIKKALKGGKYRGFLIIDPAQTASIAATSGRKHKILFGHECATGAPQYQKERIDSFRKFLSTNMETESEETDKRKCFGFEVADISPKGYYQNLSGGAASAGKTKITYDILMAPDLDAAIDLAFFGRPYKDMHNVDNSLLFLNEIEGKSKKEILDIYFNKVDKWGRKIDKVISALSAALGENRGPGPNPPPQPNPDIPSPNDNNSLSAEILRKIEELLNSETDPYAKQIYQEVKNMKTVDGITLKTVEKLKELLELIKFAYGGSSPDNTLQKLEIFSSAATNTVNNHKENPGDEDGYATKAWKKIANFSKKRQEVIEKSRMAEAQTVAELNQIYQQMKENEKFAGSLKESVEKKSYPRAQIIAAIREKKDNASPEEKALIKLIKDFVIKAEIDTDFGDDLDESVLQTLKTKKVALTNYATNNKTENKVYRNLSTEKQNTITLLISELAEKIIKMEKAIQAKKEQDRKNNKNPNTSPPAPFLKTTFGKITISLIVVVVLGLII